MSSILKDSIHAQPKWSTQKLTYFAEHNFKIRASSVTITAEYGFGVDFNTKNHRPDSLVCPKQVVFAYWGSTDSATIHTHSISHLYRSQRCLVLPPPSLSTVAGRTAKTPHPMSAADANMSGTVDALARNMTGLYTNVTAQDSQPGH